MSDEDPWAGSVVPGSVGTLGSTWAWLTFGLLVVVLGVLLVVGRVAVAVILDLIALWPLPALLVVVYPIARWARRRFPTLQTVVPLILLTWLLSGVAWFYSEGVPPAPSRAADVTGTATAPTGGRFVADTDGRLVVEAGATAPFVIGPLRTGGAVAPPQVAHTDVGGAISAVATPHPDGAWYRSEGWRLGLLSGPSWQLDLRATTIEADLRSFADVDAHVHGDGEIRLGRGQATITVTGGTLVVMVPVSYPVSVQGSAVLPDGWDSFVGGGVSPTPGVGIYIDVRAGTVTVVEADS